jgi:hypothetical protein
MTVSHDARMSELQNRVQSIDASLSELDAKYIELAGRWDTNDQGLLKEASIIETRIGNLKREKALTLAAAGQLELKRKAEQEEQEREVNRQKLVEAKRHADAVMAANVDIDRQFAALVALLSQRTTALKALGNSGVVSDTVTNRMMAKEPITAAACHAGLARYIDIVAVANASLRPLADGNRALLGVGKDVEPAAAPVQRRRLSNGG